MLRNDSQQLLKPKTFECRDKEFILSVCNNWNSVVSLCGTVKSLGYFDMTELLKI